MGDSIHERNIVCTAVLRFTIRQSMRLTKVAHLHIYEY